MAVAVVHQGPSLTAETYNAVVEKLTDGKGLRSPSDWPVECLLVHVAGPAAGGFRVVDVWESEEAAKRFGEALGPIMQEVGIEEQPEVYPAQAFVSA